MSAVTVYCVYPTQEFDSGIEGINPILASGTTIDSSNVAAVIAAGLANGVIVVEGVPTSPGEPSPSIAYEVELGVAGGAAELDSTGNVPLDELGNVTEGSSSINGGTP